MELEPGVVYMARDDRVGSKCEPTEMQERSPKAFIESEGDGLFKLNLY